MADEISKGKAQTAKLQFHYIKSPDYREIPVHGALGGITAQRKIWISMFTERGAIPRIVEFDVLKAEGSEVVEFNEAVAKPSHVDTRQGIIRHVEVSAFLDIDVARRIHKWLGERIAEASGPAKTSVKQ